MALDITPTGLLSLPASGDLSTKQFHPVKIDSNGQVAQALDGAAAIGILYDKPTAQGQICSVAPLVPGAKLKGQAGANVAKGAALTSEATTGDLITAATGDYIYGYALESAVDQDIFQFLALPNGISA